MTSAAAPAKASPGRAVLRTETRLFLREPGSLFWIIGFPSCSSRSSARSPASASPTRPTAGSGSSSSTCRPPWCSR